MRIGVIGEGDTEFYCLPTLVAKLNHVVVGVRNLGGVGDGYEWKSLFERRIYPYVRSFAKSASRPDKVVIVLDRERRHACCGSLACDGVTVLTKSLQAEQLTMPVSVVLANRQIECWLFSNPELLDRSPRFKRQMSSLLGSATDESNILDIVHANLKPGKNWDKVRDGKALAQRLDLNCARTLGRSRSLRKFVKELA